MDSLKQRELNLHSETSAYQKRINKAKEHVRKTFDRFEEPYVSFSGGKDSTVLLCLIDSLGYEPDVFHFDWGARDIPGVEEHTREMCSKYCGELLYRSSERVGEEYVARDEHHGMAGIMGWVSTLGEERGWDAAMLGIRAEESNDRRDQYDGVPPTSVDSDTPQTRVAPIHHLRTEDVWAYIVSNEIEYHEIYDKMSERLGRPIDHDENRLVTLYDTEFEHLGSLEVSQMLYPGAANELKEVIQDYVS